MPGTTQQEFRDSQNAISSYIAKYGNYSTRNVAAVRGTRGDVDPGDVGYYTQFKESQKITKSITYTATGQTLKIKNGDEAVAFEIYRDGAMVYFSNSFTIALPSGIPVADVVVYAVQADGKRVEVKKI